MRVAIYYSPGSCSPLLQVAEQWFEMKTTGTMSESETADMLKDPKRYGFHATIKPPFKLKDQYSIGDVEQQMQRFCQHTSSFITPHMEVAKIGRFFCIKPVEESWEINSLASSVVQRFDNFREPAREKDLERRRLTGLNFRQDELLIEWGYPYVLSEFIFHMTLTGKITDERQNKSLREELKKRFSQALSEPLNIDSLSMYTQEGSADFIEHKRFSLRSS